MNPLATAAIANIFRTQGSTLGTPGSGVASEVPTVGLNPVGPVVGIETPAVEVPPLAPKQFSDGQAGARGATELLNLVELSGGAVTLQEGASQLGVSLKDVGATVEQSIEQLREQAARQLQGIQNDLAEIQNIFDTYGGILTPQQRATLEAQRQELLRREQEVKDLVKQETEEANVKLREVLDAIRSVRAEAAKFRNQLVANIMKEFQANRDKAAQEEAERFEKLRNKARSGDAEYYTALGYE